MNERDRQRIAALIDALGLGPQQPRVMRVVPYDLARMYDVHAGDVDAAIAEARAQFIAAGIIVADGAVGEPFFASEDDCERTCQREQALLIALADAELKRDAVQAKARSAIEWKARLGFARHDGGESVMAHIAYFLEDDGISAPEGEAIRKLQKHSLVFVIPRNAPDRLTDRAVDYACALSPFLIPPMFMDRHLRLDPLTPPEPPCEPPPPFPKIIVPSWA